MEFYNYTDDEKKILKQFRITITEIRRFIPGIDCLGEKPYGSSDFCNWNCHGIDSLTALHPSIKPPCNHKAVPVITSGKGLMTPEIDKGVYEI